MSFWSAIGVRACKSPGVRAIGNHGKVGSYRKVPEKYKDINRIVLFGRKKRRSKNSRFEPLRDQESKSFIFPKCSKARRVACRPRAVRSRYPDWMRYGSYTSSKVVFSSLTAAASDSTPTGPPRKLSRMDNRILRSISSNPAESIPNQANAS